LSYLAGGHGVRKRGVEEIAAALFDALAALGTVVNLEQAASAALGTRAPGSRDGRAAGGCQECRRDQLEIAR
jgi:hypothetical protein